MRICIAAIVFLLSQCFGATAQSVGITANYALLNGSASVQNVIIGSANFVSAQSGTWVLSGIGCAQARIGAHWDGIEYVPPAPFASWTQSTCFWVSPVAVPILTPAMISANQKWQWNNVSLQWAIVQF